MPTYALLGATGATGSSILRYLLQEPPKDLKLNVFVRSKSKLTTKFPELESNAPFQLSIVEGTPQDADATRRCLKDADVILNCIGTNDSRPGQTVVQESAAAIIDALKFHRKEQVEVAFKTPTVLQLRSITLNNDLNHHEPRIMLAVLHWALGAAYGDLRRACEMLDSAAAEEPALLETIIVDPPALHDSDGTTKTGHKLVFEEGMSTSLSYADLGAAFCELAEKRAGFAGKAVGVAATGEVKENWPILMSNIFWGAKGRIFG